MCFVFLLVLGLVGKDVHCVEEYSFGKQKKDHYLTNLALNTI